ncbi:hypothetical protein LMH87_006721 [Akanthomyces muscarius]|uniref:Glutathione S-transferase n=1 Tax=Akanthomyces muscarius TaxID=2231603 RepID=A0A9W8QNU7_AKAMU|nr:hypothetical protein LMH87_006721 [Akanthomyces muscarius]KAJ4165074.1 hypothetical protein LMH87_006721 [Akanthomyces muscarius]
MVFGTLFTTDENSRSIAIKILAKANNLDLNIIQANLGNATPEHLAVNKLGKIPTFVDNDGFILSECTAVAIYIALQDDKTTLFGTGKKDYASILRWMSFFNTEVLIPFAGWLRPLLGKEPYEKSSVDKCQVAALRAVKTVEEFLENRAFLVGDKFTLADLFCASLLARGFQFFFGTQWRLEHPNVTRWYDHVTDQEIYTAVVPKQEFLEQPILQNGAPIAIFVAKFAAEQVKAVASSG